MTMQVEGTHESTAVDESTTRIFRMGELFSGPGGLGIGAKMAAVPGSKIVHQWATDYDADTCNTYATNVVGNEKAESVIHSDIRELDYKVLHDLGDIDALSFGFPCNDFSAVGERRGFEGTFGPLYTYGVEALRQFQPSWFLAENVGGIRSGGGAELRQIFRDMIDAGYRLYPHYYKFEQYGVPQARHRMIVIGIRNDLDVEFKIPSPAPYADADVTAKTALSGIPRSAPNQEFTKQTARVIERLEHIPEGGNAWVENMPEHLKINTRTKLSSIYRRLDSKKPAYTVTGSGGGGTHIYHWSEPRALTNRERARLQTFPDDFEFKGNKESVRKQVGMAVPPRGAQIIFEAVLKSFAGIDYESVEPSLVEFLPKGEQISL